MAVGRQKVLDECCALLLIEHAVEQLDVLQIVRQHVIQHEAVHEAVLQVFEFFREHDLVDAAVAVDQRERAARLDFERGLDDREHRRDARAAGKRDVLLPLIRVQMREEAAVRRHHVDGVAGLQRVEREIRKAAAAHALDADAQFAVAVVIGDADADRIRPARFLTVDVRFQRDELALRESKMLAQFDGDFEGDRDRVGGFGPHFADAQRMKLRSGHISMV